MSVRKTPTPEAAKQVRDTTIERLNGVWDLGLPRALIRKINLDDEQKKRIRTCFAHINYLSWRSERTLESVLTDFDDSAKNLYRDWLFKPAQEKGTFVDRPISKPFIIREDNVAKVRRQSSPAQLSEHREQLLSLLESLLFDEVRLAKDSDAYDRSAGSRLPSSPSIDLSVSPKRSRTETARIPMVSKKRSTDNVAGKDKKRRPTSIGDKAAADGTGKKKPRTSFEFTTSTSSTSTLPNIYPTPQSFETAGSPVVSRVFTPPMHDRTSSNETSRISDDEGSNEESQDFFPTQEAVDLYQDPSVRRSMGFEETSYFLNELVDKGPFRETLSSDSLPPNLSFRMRYELHRIAGQLADITVRQLYKETINFCKSQEPDLKTFWSGIKQSCDKYAPGANVSRNKSSQAAWDSAIGNFRDTSSVRSVFLSGVLEWCEPSQQGLFNVKLSPLRLEKSCRLDRRFGGDRCMFLKLPFLSPANVPSDPRNLRAKAAELRDAVTQWLGLKTHYIAGRWWRAYYLEPEKRKVGGQRPPIFKLCLFAVDGQDFVPFSQIDGDSCERRSPLPIQEFINWYMPIKDNMKSTDLKLFQRLALGLSRTSPTVKLEQHEFIHVKDKINVKDVMNDGCARMSRAMAEKISEMLGLEYTPSVFQGRTSGAKGLWVVEDTDVHPHVSNRGFWIEVSDSQMKVEPHPQKRNYADGEHRKFEVLKWTGVPKPAVMNIQLMGILHHGGVSKKVLEDRLRSDTHAFYTCLVEAMKTNPELRTWVHQYLRGLRDADAIPTLGSFLLSRSEQLNLLLDSGFRPEGNQVLLKRLRSALQEYLNQYVEKLAIRLEMSTSVWCIPDPYGVLEPDQVHLSFSQLWPGPKGKPLMSLDGLSVLVYRSPGYLPSDVQQVKGIFKSRLQHIINVIVFSTKGHKSLASKLSGGDYDGDTCWLTWDPELADNFKSCRVPKLPSPEECGLEAKALPLSKIFKSFDENGKPTANNIDTFLSNSFSFNLAPSWLGSCSNEHEKVAYHRGHADPGAIKLAALASYLVDSAKQGFAFSENSWFKLRNNISATKLNPPAYKDSQYKKKLTSIVDYLKFNVAEDEKDKILTEFQQKWPERKTYDKSLSMPWLEAEDRYRTDPVGEEILVQLKRDIIAMKNVWLPALARDHEEDDKYYNIVKTMYEHVVGMEPLKREGHEIYKRYLEEKGKQFSRWSELRASCVYYVWPSGLAPWYAVGMDLCKIKAETVGEVRVVGVQMYNALKPDGKVAKRMAEREVEDQDGGEADMSVDVWGDEV